MIGDFLADASVDGWDVLLAILVAVAGWIAAGFAKRGAVRVLQKIPSINAEASLIVARVIRYALLLLTLGIVLTVLGAPLQPVLAAVILIVGVCVLALRGIASNFGAGVVIQTRHVVHVGDEIEILQFLGTVTELNGRCVVIHSTDGRTVRIPNSTLLENPLVNLTERNLYRSEIEVRTKGGTRTEEITDIVSTALHAVERVRAVPTIQTLTVARSGEVLTLRIRFWHDPHHRSEVRSAAVNAVAGALAAASIPASVDWRVPAPPLSPPPEF